MPTASPPERRIALVIGNAIYQYTTPLTNPANDAQDIVRVLKELQFQVMLKTDATLNTMADAIFAFGEQLKGGGVGLFYYAGHGIQVKGENYLIPIDANVVREDEIKRKTINVKDILDKMDEAKSHLNLVFLDACRNNPFPRSVRAVSRGLTGMNAPSGTLLAFATNPDNVAADGNGRNGTYTKHLLHYITQPGLEVGMMLRKIRTAVKEETGGQQVPWENGSMEGEFYFTVLSGTPSIMPSLSPPQPTLPTSLSQVTETPSRPAPPSPAGGTQVAGGVYPGAPQTLRNSLGMEFVLIPAGEFQMGSTDIGAYEDEKPVYTVRLTKPFYLGKYEVTQVQWEAVMGNNPSRFKSDVPLPVENVSWQEVQEFIRRLNARERSTTYRLPTEAEWEYAARARSTKAYSFGNSQGALGHYPELERYAWHKENSGNKTHSMRQLEPNGWGLYDMHGNVSEWVQDWAGKYTQSMAVNPEGPSSGFYRVYRGGSWRSTASGCRSASRRREMPGYRSDDLGFRLLRVAQ